MARREEVKDVYPGGHEVLDPYRWLEDPDSEETVKWVEAQNERTNAFLNTLPNREVLKKKLTEKYNYAKTGSTFKRGKGEYLRYYYYKNDGLQNQYVLMMQAGLDSPAEEFFDPNLLSSDGTKSIGANAFSDSGRYWAHGISASGSDWQTIFVREITSKQNTEDKIEWVKFSGISWVKDDSGFFYSRYPEPKSLQSVEDNVEGNDLKRGSETDSNVEMSVYFHKLGTKQSEDVLIFKPSENPKWLPRASMSDDGKYLIISISESTAPVNRVYIGQVDQILSGTWDDSKFMRLIDNFDAGYDYVTNTESKFYFRTNKDADLQPRYKVICIDIQDAKEEKWADILEHKEEVLNDVLCVGEKYLVVCYMNHAQETLSLFKLADGSLVQQIQLPDVGSVGSLSGKREHMEFFYSFVGFVHPGVKFRFDLETMQSHKLREDIVSNHRPEDFETKQVFYESKDGTKIPMFIVGKKGQEHSGNTCTLLYGYGGFSISITPSFNPFRTVFINHFNALLCVANIRGGGEYGEDWHEAGCNNNGKPGKLNKQRGFDDFQAAAEYLIQQGYTCPAKIAINGGSNGGLLVGACVNQRPDLFAAAIPQVGVMDMLRFHKFTIGYAWCSDYGCSENSEEEFKALYAISPLHNIKPRDDVQYPAVLVTTADHDDRVVPLHSFKYAAQLQYAFEGNSKQTRPLLIRIETKSGHGAGKPTAKVIEEVADIYAFIGSITGTEFSD
ncbi:hypothetical protein GUITHDRAFT_161224, partial [Guillardia theta CCMP2712]